LRKTHEKDLVMSKKPPIAGEEEEVAQEEIIL